MHALLEEGPQALHRIPGSHCSETAEYTLLPESERAIVALSHISAYSVCGGGWHSPALLNLYECSAFRDVPCWFFSEKARINQKWSARQGVALPWVALDIGKHFVDLNIKHAVRSDSNWLTQVHTVHAGVHGQRSEWNPWCRSQQRCCAPVLSIPSTFQ
ncbi:hypothetical protein EDB92DRAFT_1370574 [Lactarius akahatsu]|uniref:Uncharacterized protein n=1 Tax=Lactarius akahatsu TaxID=416441 RepID=A0AAD4QAW3_9AGAM|nr:hypothetical protein EDB92DRAFT_1370574 [Lactarius akahatsu]